ncbi:hypothetical protein FACS189411_10200 [Bacteroidia bacterium]|nr:hypothetical protein FACS189411_10200 [Bacteroidia bacterium]
MELKGILAGRSVFAQALILLAIIFAGFVLAGLVSLVFTASSPSAMLDPDVLRWTQLLSEILMFLLPALVVAWLCSANLSDYLSLKMIPDGNVWAGAFVSMLLLSPVVTFIGYLNAQMKLPAFMASIEQWMQQMEEMAAQATELMFAGNGWVALVFNLIVIALAAGVCEEFFFRGTLQRIIGRKFANYHAIIWITAIIFSIIHLQFYGFVPRVLLGAYFGYLLYWSKSIWLPVFAHFLNNAFAVIGMSNQDLKENAIVSGEIPDSEVLNYALASIVASGLFFFCAKYLYRRLQHVD